MLFGMVGEKNIEGIADSVSRFCEIENTKMLGHRTAGVLRVCCDAQDKQIHDISVAIYLGERLNAGRFASAAYRDTSERRICVSVAGRRAGLGDKENIRSRRINVKCSDFIGFSPDGSLLLVCDKEGEKVDFLVKLRLRDIYSLRLNNITERTANCLAVADDATLSKIDKKWPWTRKCCVVKMRK